MVKKSDKLYIIYSLWYCLFFFNKKVLCFCKLLSTWRNQSKERQLTPQRLEE